MIVFLCYSVGASACVEVQRYDEALKWCDDGLAVSSHSQNLSYKL